MITEVYPRLWSASYAKEDRSADQHDAYAVARWLQEADQRGEIRDALAAPEPAPIAATGLVEGWILGASWPPEKSKPTRSTSKAKTTQPGYTNRNLQEVVKRTSLHGNDHNQVTYILRCQSCGHRYGANGSDIFQRRCPACGAGSPGLPIR